MRSHLTAFGIGAGLAVLAAGAVALIAPRFAFGEDDGEGVHIVNIGDGDNGSFHLKEDNLNVTAEWKGDFSFAADGRSLKSLNGRLEVAKKEKGVSRKAIFESKDGIITAKLFKDEDAAPAGPDADREAGDLLQLFARSSGVNADDRVTALLADGGTERVIDEIGQLAGSHAVGAYIETLAEQAELTDADVGGLVDRVKGLDSDYAKRSALTALLSEPTLSDASVAKVVEAAKTIEGDHEVRLIVEALAEKDISARSLSVATTLIEQIEGDHEIRLAVEALLENESLGDEDLARAIDAAAKTIEGDYEMRLALEAADERVNGEKAGAAALRAIAKIKGAHDRRLAIEEFAAALEPDSAHWLLLIETVKGIDSDHDRRLAIEALASEAPERADIKAALRKAAEGISSDHDRRLALEALE